MKKQWYLSNTSCSLYAFQTRLYHKNSAITVIVNVQALNILFSFSWRSVHEWLRYVCSTIPAKSQTNGLWLMAIDLKLKNKHLKTRNLHILRSHITEKNAIFCNYVISYFGNHYLSCRTNPNQRYTARTSVK